MAKKKADKLRLGDLIEQIFDQYEIPTKKDFELLIERMEKLENLIKQTNLAASMSMEPGRRGTPGRRGRRSGVSASDIVLNMMRDHGGTVDFSIIKEKTGYDDKKLRNIIFRLYKNGKIIRISRGTYQLPADDASTSADA